MLGDERAHEAVLNFYRQQLDLDAIGSNSVDFDVYFDVYFGGNEGDEASDLLHIFLQPAMRIEAERRGSRGATVGGSRPAGPSTTNAPAGSSSSGSSTTVCSRGRRPRVHPVMPAISATYAMMAKAGGQLARRERAEYCRYSAIEKRRQGFAWQVRARTGSLNAGISRSRRRAARNQASAASACSSNASSGTMSSAFWWVASSTTGQATPRSWACNQLAAQTHHWSPGLRPGN